MKEYKVVNDYVYFRDLFSDTMGINYRVAPVQNRKPTGHKVLCEVNPAISGNADMWKRAKLLLEGIRKSNIPFLYSPEKINVSEKGCQLIYEYFKGKNFEQILVDAEKKGMPINFDLAMSISIAIADIIEVGSSIIVSGEKSYHGFLTPDNILIHYDGKIFLKNYGIFQYLEKNDQFYSDNEKRYGSWLTPEFIRKDRIVSQSDIYHLGYLIYRILTGKYFSYSAGEDFDSKFANLTFKQYMPSTDKNFLTNVITFLKKTLNPDPLKRFLTIKEFKDFIANYFHIEELSSITFNLAYFMNSLYGESVEEEDKILKQELMYVVPEPKKEAAPATRKEDLVSGILEGLDERKKMPSWLWPVMGVVGLVAAIGIYFAVTSGRKASELTAQQQAEAAQRLKAQQEQASQIQAMADKIKELEALKSTADEAQKKALELEKQRLEEQKRQKEAEQAKMKAEDEQRKLAEATRLQKEEEAKKAQEELDRKKADEEKQKQEEQQKKMVEAAKTKEGDQIPLTEATVKPQKISGNPPAINASLKKKYSGKEMTIPTTILVDENGNVAKVKVLTGSVPNDIKALLEETLANWKYSPAQKDNIKVKVWLSIPFKFSF